MVIQNKFAAPGEQINAMIYLSVYQPFQNARLVCRLKGKEKTALTERKSRRVRDYHSRDGYRTVYWTEYYNEGRTIYQNENVFLQGPIAAGNYQFPYSFVLPYNIPSSYEEYKDEFNYAKVKYEAKVFFEGAGYGVPFHLEDEDKVFVIQVYP